MSSSSLDVRYVRAKVEYRYQFVLRQESVSRGEGNGPCITVPDLFDSKAEALEWYNTAPREGFVALTPQQFDHPNGNGEPGLYRVATNIQVLEDLGSANE